MEENLLISRNLTIFEAISHHPLRSFCFCVDRKTKIAVRHLVGWYIFDFSSEIAKRNLTKLDMKQDFNVFYKICVFRADWKTKITALAICQHRLHTYFRCTMCGPLVPLSPALIGKFNRSLHHCSSVRCWAAVTLCCGLAILSLFCQVECTSSNIPASRGHYLVFWR